MEILIDTTVGRRMPKLNSHGSFGGLIVSAARLAGKMRIEREERVTFHVEEVGPEIPMGEAVQETVPGNEADGEGWDSSWSLGDFYPILYPIGKSSGGPLDPGDRGDNDGKSCNDEESFSEGSDSDDGDSDATITNEKIVALLIVESAESEEMTEMTCSSGDGLLDAPAEQSLVDRGSSHPSSSRAQCSRSRDPKEADGKGSDDEEVWEVGEDWRNEWAGAIDEVLQETGSSGHGHAPGETGISTVTRHPTESRSPCSSLPWLHHQLVELPCPSSAATTTTTTSTSNSEGSRSEEGRGECGLMIALGSARNQLESPSSENSYPKCSGIQEEDASSPPHPLNLSSSFSRPIHHHRRICPRPQEPHGHNLSPLERTRTRNYFNCCHNISNDLSDSNNNSDLCQCPSSYDQDSDPEVQSNSDAVCDTSSASHEPLTDLTLPPTSAHCTDGPRSKHVPPQLEPQDPGFSNDSDYSENSDSDSNSDPDAVGQNLVEKDLLIRKGSSKCDQQGTCEVFGAFPEDILQGSFLQNLFLQLADCPVDSFKSQSVVNASPGRLLEGRGKEAIKGDSTDSFPPPISDNIAMQQRLSSSEHLRLRSVLRKPGHSKKQRGRSVTFNESLNLFYEAECSCWVHEDEYARLRQEEHEKREREEIFHYEPPPIEFDDPPTLSPPEGYKDRFFPQEIPIDPDVTRVTPPSPPAARRKVFLKENPIANGQEDEEDAEDARKNKTSRLGGILKGGRLWRSNSAEGKKVISPQEEPDVVKCTESRYITILDDYIGPENSIQQTPITPPSEPPAPLKVSTGTAPLRTSEQIRLAVDSTLRFRNNKKKPECSSLVEKLRWLTSLDDDDSSDSNTSGFATWPSRDKNGTLTKSSAGGATKADAGTSTTEEFVQSAIIRQPPINSANEAKIKQISYTLEDIDEGLKSGENELESFITEDGGRIERLRKRYGDDVGGDDYGFSRRPSVKGIKPKFSSTNQIFAQFTMRKSDPPPPPPPPPPQHENAYENTLDSGSTNSGNPNNPMALLDNARILNYEFANAPGRQSEESRAHFEMIRQSFEPGAYVNFNRPHSWSVSTLPHPHYAAHHTHSHSHSMCMMAGGVPGNNGGAHAQQQQQQQQINNLSSSNNSNPGGGTAAGTSSTPGTGAGAGQGGSIMLPANGMPPQLLQQQQPNQQQLQQQQPSQQPQHNSSLPVMAATSHLPQSQYATMVTKGGVGVGLAQHSMYGTTCNSNAGSMYGTLPHPHQHHINNGAGGSAQQQQAIYGTAPQNNLNGPGMGQCPGVGGLENHSLNLQQQQLQQQQLQQQQMYGTVRRVPNVIGRPLFLHYGALSVEAHPNKISYPRNSVPETPSPTQQPPPIRYYGPPIRYYNPPPPVPPRTAASAPSSSAVIAGAVINVSLNCNSGGQMSSATMMNVADHERGAPEGATDEEPGVKEPYSMNI